jgi:hypothetical protein
MSVHIFRYYDNFGGESRGELGDGFLKVVDGGRTSPSPRPSPSPKRGANPAPTARSGEGERPVPADFEKAMNELPAAVDSTFE